ncbi:MAG: replication factor C large subunit [Nanoarchaeota archaeon]|nr:replication factor C large subunit [Nanoarchaeota archaeon]MBU1501769.1 replication factor C large subunit [Nanoarchaeota archaeon]MBU2458861.1 replication factor C large subunit [Nanoarchaeota archaeon]
MKQTNWTEKYRPRFFSDVKDQDLAVQKVRDFVKNFPKTVKKALVLHGPPGVGKTTLAYVAKNETNSEIFELNASDLRNKEKMNSILKPAIEQKSLMKEQKIILVDEVDGISVVDRGGLLELMRLIEYSTHPIIITANDIWNKKFSDLRRKTESVQLKEVDFQSIKEILIGILRNERKFISNDVLTNISIKARGDVRAAINDLQTASSLPDPSKVLIDERNKEMDIFTALKMIFKGKPNNALLSLYDSVNKPLDEIMLWVEENIPLEYHGEELVKAYDALSKVDIFKRRIYRQQYWRFLVYENAFLSYGISSSKNPNETKSGFTSYKKPTRILKMWLNNRRTEKKKSIAKKYARYVHIGEKRALYEFATVKAFLTKPEIQKELKLTEDEIEYLGKETLSNKI